MNDEDQQRWYGQDDILRGDRVLWLAGEQQAGRGTVIRCRMCGGSAFDPDDPFDNCPACRGVGAVLSG